MPADLEANIEALAAYTTLYPELRTAHHFLYDLRVPPNEQPQFIVMGINPGETDHDWLTAPKPTEETSRYDFHTEKGSGRSAIRWSKAAAFYLDDAHYALAEMFNWSSRDGRQFRQRFGPIEKSPHLAICTKLNLDLIEHHRPQAVVVPGINSDRLCAQLYGLTLVESVRHDAHRIVEVYSDGERPWIFTKHWTGSFGLTNTQREAIRDVIRRYRS